MTTRPELGDQGGSEEVLADPGWFPDPQIPYMHRFWTGEEWTDHRLPSTTVLAEQESHAVGYWTAVLIPFVGFIYGIENWRIGGQPVVVVSIVCSIIWALILLSIL